MVEIKHGTITKELFSRPGIKAFLARIENEEEKCIAYPELTGDVEVGDEVLLNTTALTLGLGTGGYHYIMANISGKGKKLTPGGHIMKLRYTPVQAKVLSVEEEESPHRMEMLTADSLDNIPVLVGTLHSMLAPICMFLSQKGFKVAYVMTDGAALPIAFSNMVYQLKSLGLLSGSVTVGHAFGGDLEAVNVYSGLLAARKILKADVIICTMGPGIVGTGTKWGFTGIEQGEILNAVDSLQGIPVAIPRISFADARSRHRGISHHTFTVLKRVCRVKAVIPLAELEEDKMTYVLQQLRTNDLLDKYQCCLQNAGEFYDLLTSSEMNFTTMGRGIKEEREFFLTLGAAAITAERMLRGDKLNTISLA